MVDHDRAVGEFVDRLLCDDAVVGSDEATASVVPFEMELSVDVCCVDPGGHSEVDADRVSVGEVVAPAAGCAGTVPGGECDGVIEKEQWSPSAGSSEWDPPVPESGLTDDPELARVVSHDVLVVVDDAASVAGEHAASVDGVQIAPRVDTISSRRTPRGGVPVHPHESRRSSPVAPRAGGVRL